MQASKLMKFKLLLTLYFKLLFYTVCLPLLAFVILSGNLLERYMIRRKRQQQQLWSAEQAAVHKLSVECSAILSTTPDDSHGSHIVSLIVSAVSLQEVIHMLQQKLGCKVRPAAVQPGDSLNPTCSRMSEPTIWEEMIPRFLSAFASSTAKTGRKWLTEDADHLSKDVAIDVIRINRSSPIHHVTSSYQVAIRSSDSKFLNHALQAFDPTLTIRHEKEDDDSSIETKSPEIWQQIEELADLLIDCCQAFVPFIRKKLMNESMDFCDREKLLSVVFSLGRELLMHAQSVTITLKVLISQVMRRITCCNNYQFLLFKKLNRHEVDPDNLSLAYSDCLPAELLKRIQESSGLSEECITLSCITSALRAYAQEMAGTIPRDTSAFLQSCRELDGLEGSAILLPVESANDLVVTSAKISSRLVDSVRDRESNQRDKQFLVKTLPKFMFNWIQSFTTAGHEIVIKSCHVDGDEQSFIRSVHHWPCMETDTLLKFILMHRKGSISVGVICKKNAIQSATLLAELLTKSVTNLCIAFRIQWDRRSPPSTPSDKSSHSA